MRKSLIYLTFIDTVFVLLLALSGYFGRIFYYLAFVIPFLIVCFLKKKTNAAYVPPKFKISAKDFALVLPTLAPTLALIFLVSWLTSLLLSFIGEGSTSDVSGNIFVVIAIHAVVTPVLEEGLFRYIPIALIAPHTKRGAVLVSALFFALVHCNLYQLPYAFLAGVIFASLDIAFDSILPSVLLHFLNNLVSVIWLRGASNETFVFYYVVILAVLAIVSFVPLFLLKKDYKEKFLPIISDKSKYELSYEPILFIIMTLIIAVTNLL